MSFDAIIIGTGFGGSICAARLAERGFRVLVLERGPWWGPLQRHRPAADRRELPRGPLGVRKFMRGLRSARKGRRFEWLFFPDGLLEFHRFDRLNTLTASAVGGGSHIYTSILVEPTADFFDAFPQEINAEEMSPYFERVRQMLRPAPVPHPPEKSRVFARALEEAGLPQADYPPLGIVWGEDPQRPRRVMNAAGAEQFTSTWRGDAFVGCEDGSKTTLDLTYLPLAERLGAEVRPLCEVVALGRGGGGYIVDYRDRRKGGALRRESAPRLIVAAGTLNTLRLLFRARDRDGTLPNLPATLGRFFSPNGDLASLLWMCADLGDSSRGPSVGAFTCISREGKHRFALGELGLPVDAAPLPEFLHRRLRRSTLLFGMGRDTASGTIGFDGKGLTTSLGRSSDLFLYDEMESAMRRVARSYAPRRICSNIMAGRGAEGLFTVHPLGGGAIGSNPKEGVTDHRGEVFGNPGLFIADGSLYPRAPGTAPSMTIAALAERQAALME